MRVSAVAMEKMKRYAIYYTPEDSPDSAGFAQAAAEWLGWDLARGRAVAQPVFDLPLPMADITAAPRKYGFHGTIKPPFRLADGVKVADFHAATERLAAGLQAVDCGALRLVDLDGFLAFVPQGNPAPLQHLAARVVHELDRFRAPLTAAEVARRRPERLTLRQRELLGLYGYPYVLEEFQFHLTLTGPLAEPQRARVAQAADTHFAGLLAHPLHLRELCLCGEDELGQFHLLHRYRLSA